MDLNCKREEFFGQVAGWRSYLVVESLMLNDLNDAREKG
jgi:hypothetical protein